MTTIKLAVAMAMALLLASTSLTQAAGGITPDRTGNGGGFQNNGPSNGGPAPVNTRGLPQIGPGNPGGPDNSKPAPEFGDADVVADTPVLKLSPTTLSCEYHGDHFVQSGAPEIWFKNIGTETIPKGSIITVTWPDGTKQSFKLGSDLKPGASVGISGPDSADQPGFHCSARAKVTYGPPQP